MKKLIIQEKFRTSVLVFCVLIIGSFSLNTYAENRYPDGDYGTWGGCRYIKDGSTLKIQPNNSNTTSTYTPTNGYLYVPNYEPADCVGCNVAGGGKVYFKEGLCSLLKDMNIDNILIGEGFTTISSNFFENCSTINSITLPSSLLNIERQAFKNCSGLQSLSIPTEITWIGFEAFAGCANLSKIDIPSSVTAIDNLAFSNCSNLEDIVINCNLTAFNTTTSSYRQFENCIRVKSLRLISQINSSEYEIPSLSALFGDAFDSINELEFLEGSNYIRWSNGISGEGDDQIREMPFLKNVVLHEGMETIGHGAFKGSKGLKNISLPSSIKTIENRAFKGSGLVEIILPKNITTIYTRAFESCVNLKKITIGCVSLESIPAYFCAQCTMLENIIYDIRCKPQTIGAYAFWGCSSLSKITIPSSVTTIEDDAFNGCVSVTQLIAEPLVPPICGTYPHYPFDGISRNNVLFVPKESHNEYEKTEVWKTFLNNYSYDWEQTMMQREALLVETSATEVEFEWSEEGDAEKYYLEISEDGEDKTTSFTVTSYNTSNTHYTNVPRKVSESNIYGIRFMLSGLKTETLYNYSLTAFNSSDEIIKSYLGSFGTTEAAEGLDEIIGNYVPCTKVLRNGQIFILRGEKEYTVTGQEVK